jgi:tRNA threonylcarbamoyladenosine biosynthesis protein TsaE
VLDAVGDRNVGVDARALSARMTEHQLHAHGIAIGRRLVAPALVTLTGDLGAGKTTLVQAICRGLGVTEPVTSPTFALIHEYASPSARVVHCDLYRLESLRDVESLGLDDCFADPCAIVLIEWPERAGAMLPAATVAITLSHVEHDEQTRRCAEVWAR